jgi:hypothetical protein
MREIIFAFLSSDMILRTLVILSLCKDTKNPGTVKRFRDYYEKKRIFSFVLFNDQQQKSEVEVLLQ